MLNKFSFGFSFMHLINVKLIVTVLRFSAFLLVFVKLSYNLNTLFRRVDSFTLTFLHWVIAYLVLKKPCQKCILCVIGFLLLQRQGNFLQAILFFKYYFELNSFRRFVYVSFLHYWLSYMYHVKVLKVGHTDIIISSTSRRSKKESKFYIKKEVWFEYISFVMGSFFLCFNIQKPASCSKHLKSIRR